MCSNIPQNPNGKAQCGEAYDSVEFTLTTGSTDYNLDSQQSAYLLNVLEPHYLEIYTTQDISVKFNATTEPAVTLTANTLRVFDRQIAHNIFLTNSSGSSATVRIYVK